MACVWAQLEPLTQLYGAASCITIAAVAVAREAYLAEPWMLAKKASTPLLSSPARETWIDTTRFVLMVFIVMGHYVCIPCSYIAEQSYWLGPLLAWINLFVMPGFAALSGYLSKGPLTQARISRVLIFVLAPYILSKIIYWAWFSFTFRTIGYFDPFDAFSNSMALEWYLIVLVQWRLAIALMSPMNQWALVGTSVAIGLVSGNWVSSSAALALHRACSFFPFFVLGYAFDLAQVREVLTRSSACLLGLRTIFVGVLALFYLSPGIARLFMANTVGDLNFDYGSAIPTHMGIVNPNGFMQVMAPLARANCGSEWVFSFVHRLVRYELGALLLLGLLAWIPSSSPVAQFGKYTMYPYLIHPWIFQLWMLPLMNRHMPVLFWSLRDFSAGGYIWILAVIFAPVLTAALSTSPVRFLTSAYIEPTWLGPLFLSAENLPRSGKAAKDLAVPLVPLVLKAYDPHIPKQLAEASVPV